MKSTAVIIGGGINGVSIAYNLAKQGVGVTLIEKNAIASGPTGYSCAIIRQHYSNRVTARMANRSHIIWTNFDEIIGGDAGFTHTGFFVAGGPEDVPGLKKNIELQRSLGINTQFVDPKEIKEIEPHADLTGIAGGAYEPEGGYCDPNSAAQSFVKAGRDLGATYLTGVAATGIEVEGGRVNGVKTTEGDFGADAVIVAAGPWSPRLLDHLGIETPISALRVKIGVFKRPPTFERHAIWGDFPTKTYFRPETGNMMLVGSIADDETKDKVSDPDDVNPKVEFEVLAHYAEAAATRYPSMQDSQLANNYASMYDVTADWHPIHDQVPGYEGLYLCAGSSGHGFKLSPAVGEMVSQMVLHGKSPEDDINLFSFDRFETGNLVKGEYDHDILG